MKAIQLQSFESSSSVQPASHAEPLAPGEHCTAGWHCRMPIRFTCLYYGDNTCTISSSNPLSGLSLGNCPVNRRLAGSKQGGSRKAADGECSSIATQLETRHHTPTLGLKGLCVHPVKNRDKSSWHSNTMLWIATRSQHHNRKALQAPIASLWCMRVSSWTGRVDLPTTRSPTLLLVQHAGPAERPQLA